MAARATVLNEYGWLWLTATARLRCSPKLYPNCSGRARPPRAARTQRVFSRRGDGVLAGPPQLRGLLHFVYLTFSFPGVFTADHFRDVTKLNLNPWFEDYMSEAFKPLGVYLTSSSRRSRRGRRARSG